MKLTAPMDPATNKPDLQKKYNPDHYFTAVAERLDIYNIDELGPTTDTVF